MTDPNLPPWAPQPPSQQWGQPTYPPSPPMPHAAPVTAPAGRKRLAAGLIAASLVAGTGGGLAGAAIWDRTHTGAAADTGTGTVDAAPAVHQGAAPATGSVEEVAAAVLPSVVKIDVSGSSGAGSGSGIILTGDGEILTNNHVVALADGGGRLTVYFNDGSHAQAKVLGADPLTDTAVIKAAGVSGLKAATIGRSSALQVGQGVVAIGSPFGLDSTVTSGIVSAVDRPVNVGSDSQGNATVYPAIQTDAAINPGNSGGPLVDLNGDVVGIDASIRTASSGSVGGESGSIGLGFAIPIDEVMPVIAQMRQGDTPTHARLGIGVADASSAGSTGSADPMQGALVRQVTAGSVAAKTGLSTGDVITKVDDQIITGSDSLIATVRSYRPGDSVRLTWVHQGHERSATVTLGSDAD